MAAANRPATAQGSSATATAERGVRRGIGDDPEHIAHWRPDGGCDRPCGGDLTPDAAPFRDRVGDARAALDVDWVPARDVWYHDVVPVTPAEHVAEAFLAENPLFILYTSGTKRSPRGSCTPPAATSPR